MPNLTAFHPTTLCGMEPAGGCVRLWGLNKHFVYVVSTDSYIDML